MIDVFKLYKDILNRDEVNVHGDYRLYATEFINFLSTILVCRAKKRFFIIFCGFKKRFWELKGI